MGEAGSETEQERSGPSISASPIEGPWRDFPQEPAWTLSPTLAPESRQQQTAWSLCIAVTRDDSLSEECGLQDTIKPPPGPRHSGNTPDFTRTMKYAILNQQLRLGFAGVCIISLPLYNKRLQTPTYYLTACGGRIRAHCGWIFFAQGLTGL